jgi:oligopeptide transport system substrate-binding protein
MYDPQWVKPDYHYKNYSGLITNGAFRIKAWEFKRFMLFEKNPHYWDASSVITTRIMARIIPDASTSYLAYERGEIDFLDDVTRIDFAPQLVESMKQGLRKDIHLSAAFGTYFYTFNCQKTLPDGQDNPFSDWRVRMAFYLAVDRQAIVTQVKKVGNPPARNFVPPNSIEGYFCPPGPEYNPQRALGLLAEAGYPQGQGLPNIEILYNTGYDHDKPAQAIAEMWRKQLNVNVTTRGKELKSFADDKVNHRFMICRASWYGDYSDPTTFLDMMTTDNGNNDAGFSHPEYDALIQKAAREMDKTKRMQILAEAETLLVQQQMPVMPIYYYVNLLAFRDSVRGIHPNARNMFPFKYIHVYHPN